MTPPEENCFLHPEWKSDSSFTKFTRLLWDSNEKMYTKAYIVTALYKDKGLLLIV